jgi:hypothetical protein
MNKYFTHMSNNGATDLHLEKIMPGMDATGPSGPGPAGWYRGRYRPVARNDPEGEIPSTAQHQQDQIVKPPFRGVRRTKFRMGRRIRVRGNYEDRDRT